VLSAEPVRVIVCVIVCVIARVHLPVDRRAGVALVVVVFLARR
jgi:hypothetical protein